MENNYYPFVNLPLPYDYDSLEPFIDEKTMLLHHAKHLQTYIDNLNLILKECSSLQRLSLEQLLKKAAYQPSCRKTAILNNAGGIYNHRFFFEMMTPLSEKRPSNNLSKAIDNCFGSFEIFKNEFKSASLSVFGSGYAWLVLDKGGKMRIITTSNQNTPIAAGLTALVCIDVWEHAYYLKHNNRRSDYFDDWFNLIDWSKAEEVYNSCKE